MSWEFENKSEMYNLLVGKFYGSNPEEIGSDIHKDRVKIGKAISSYLKLKSTDHVLEIGSGSGDMAESLASQVEKLYCADISLSFLDIARKKCEKWSHVSFHHIQDFDLSFIQPGTLDAIYSHAVFIHLNLYDIYWYFKSFSSALKEKGLIYIDFISSNELNLNAESYFIEHAKYYQSSKNHLSTLLSFHNPQDIIKLAKHFNLHSEIYWIGTSGTVGLILRKLSNPSIVTLIFYRIMTGFNLLKLRFKRRFFSQ